MSKTELYLSKIVKYGLYVVLLTPLAFWPKALFPFLTPKFILFQILVEIVFAAWLALKVLNNANGKNHYANDANRESKSLAISGIRNNYILLALSGFIVVSFISALLGVDFSRSFWGIGPRMTGLFAEFHFLAWFLVLVSVFKRGTMQNETQNNAEKFQRQSASSPRISAISYLNFSFFVALAVVATAFYQNPAWGLGFGSTMFNNPTFVAPYLIFHFFWGIYQTVKSIKFKWIFGIAASFILLTIFFIQIRGAILGLLAGSLFLLVTLILTNVFGRRIKIILSAGFLIILLTITGFWNFRNADFLRNGILRKLTEISLTSVTVQTRLLAWQTALQGFKDVPFFGTGPENFNYLFNKHYNPRFLKFGGGGFGETWFDKPHNAFLEILIETGIAGAAAYILIWFVVAFYLFKLFKSNKTNTSIIPIMEVKFLSIILSSAFIAYLGAVFFSFDSFGSWFGLFLFWAFLASHLKTEFPLGNSVFNNRSYSQLASLAIIFVVLALLFVNYSIWRANITDAGALRIFPKDTERGIILFKKSLTYFSPYKSEYQFDLIASVVGAVEKGMPLPDLENTINFALGEADKAVAAHPKDAAKYTDMIRIYNILGTRGRDPEILAQAEAFGNKSLKLSPQRQETLFYLGRTALLKGDAKSAIKWTQLAVDADPKVKISHWYLGLAYIANNQREAGIVEIKKAFEMGYRPQNKAEEDFIKNLRL